jgi:hypothetical protein
VEAARLAGAEVPVEEAAQAEARGRSILLLAASSPF